MAIVGISGFFALLISLAYSLYLQGYVPIAFAFPFLETVELAHLKKFLWYGAFISIWLAIFFLQSRKSSENKKAEEDAQKGLRISACALFLLAFCISFSAPFNSVKEAAMETAFEAAKKAAQKEALKNSTAELDQLLNYIVKEEEQKSILTKRITLNENPILDLSNVPVTAIAALWLVLFCFLNRYIRDTNICIVGLKEHSRISYILFALSKAKSLVVTLVYVTTVPAVLLLLFTSVCVLMCGNFILAIFLFSGSVLLGFLMYAFGEDDGDDYEAEFKNIIPPEAENCDDDCECSLCTRSEEDEFNDLYDFIDSKGLEAEFDAYQTLRDEERENRKAW